MKYSVKLLVGKDIVLVGEAHTAWLAPVVKRLQQEFTVPNPEYYRREQMGLWLGGTPEQIALWWRDGYKFHFPFGAYEQVLRELVRAGIAPSISMEFRSYEFFRYGSKIKLYDYQETACGKAMGVHGGVLVAPCGSGKTQIGLEIAARLGLKTLWLTHTHDLLNQSMSRAQECFDLPSKAFGTITAGKVDIGEVITFATVQTMANLDLSQYRDEWGCIIVDECHHVAGSPTKVMQFSKVLGSLSTPYKFGLTATPKRQDGLTKCMFAYLGPKFHEIAKEDVGDKTVPVVVEWVDAGWYGDPDDVTNPDGTLNYTKLINEICADEDRNERIISSMMEIVRREPRDKSCVLVLSERVSHLTELKRRYLDWCMDHGIIPERSWQLNGKTKKSVRQTAMKELRTGEAKILFATYQLAREGLDIPNLTHVVMASPNKTDTTITQAAGRVARTAPDKDHGTVIDFVDGFPVLVGWSKKRERIYKKLQ